jgi:hypothetical protein
MIEPEIRRLIHEEIKRSMNTIIMAECGATEGKNNSTVRNMYGCGPLTTKFPVASSYGFASRAPEQTLAVLGRLGEHPASRIILSHYDVNKPELNDGEAVLYNADGLQIRLEKEKIKIGGAEADEPLVLGNVLVEFLDKLMTLLATGDFLLCGAPGSPTAPNPAKALDLNNWKQTYLTTASSNIVSQLSFSQREKG